MPGTLRDDLGHLPPHKQAELARIKDILFEEFDQAVARAEVAWKKRARIFHIVLFGSHARGGWVEDPRSGYVSDFDVLVVVNEERFLIPRADCWTLALDRFEHDPKIATPVTLITETYKDLNRRLGQGHYFFTDIVADGIALFDSGKPLAKKNTDLTAEERRAIAAEHFGQWMPSARQFLASADMDIENGWNNHAAFHLHQATECAYSCLLLVLSDYAPNTHNIVTLRRLAELLDGRLKAVWPRKTRKERRYYALLRDAYVKARYSPHYVITVDELGWLRRKVGVLVDLVEEACQINERK